LATGLTASRNWNGLRRAMRDKLIEHNQHFGQYGEVRNWKWKG